jgi:hypothetical protein
MRNQLNIYLNIPNQATVRLYVVKFRITRILHNTCLHQTLLCRHDIIPWRFGSLLTMLATLYVDRDASVERMSQETKNSAP